jgi:hypothetical protein
MPVRERALGQPLEHRLSFDGGFSLSNPEAKAGWSKGKIGEVEMEAAKSYPVRLLARPEER